MTFFRTLWFALACTSATDFGVMQEKASIKYYEIYDGGDGESLIAECALENWTAPTATNDNYLAKVTIKLGSPTIEALPSGGNSPGKVLYGLIAMLSGQAEFSASSGDKRSLGPGDLVFVQGWHAARTVGSEPASYVVFESARKEGAGACSTLLSEPTAGVFNEAHGEITEIASPQRIKLSPGIDWPTNDSTAPSINVLHTYSTAEGVALVASCPLPLTQIPNSDTYTTGSFLGDGQMTPLLSVFPPGAQIGWHSSPGLAFSVVLYGEIKWEYSGGQTFTFGAGDRMVEEEVLPGLDVEQVGHSTKSASDQNSAIVVFASDMKLKDGAGEPCNFHLA